MLQQTGWEELGSLLACSCVERFCYHTKSFLHSLGQRLGCNSLDYVVGELGVFLIMRLTANEASDRAETEANEAT